MNQFFGELYIMPVAKRLVTIWEYKVVMVNFPAKENEQILNNLGKEGWELVSVCFGTAYLKRDLGKNPQ